MSTGISWVHYRDPVSGKLVIGACLNIIVGCSHAAYTGSDGQKHAHPGCGGYGAGEPRCYAERFCSRGMSKDGVHREASKEGHWTGKVIFRPDYLARPFTHRSFMPRRDGLKRFVFLTSLSDMGHPALEIEAWKAINGMMLLSDWNVYLDLTKRPENQRERLEKWSPRECVEAFLGACTEVSDSDYPLKVNRWVHGQWSDACHIRRYVSVSDQETADALIPELLRIPAAFRGVSYEPAIGPVDFDEWLPEDRCCCGVIGCPNEGLDHIIIGGQSGAGARPFDLEWARATIQQCREASTACYVKQLGSVAIERDGTIDEWRNDRSPLHTWPVGTVFGNRTGKEEFNGRQALLKDGSGADPSEWPEDLRVQEQILL